MFRRLEALTGQPPITKELRLYALSEGLTLEVSCVDKGLPTEFYYAEVEFDSVEAAKAFTPLPEYGLGEEMTETAGFSMSHYWQTTRPNRTHCLHCGAALTPGFLQSKPLCCGRYTLRSIRCFARTQAMILFFRIPRLTTPRWKPHAVPCAAALHCLPPVKLHPCKFNNPLFLIAQKQRRTRPRSLVLLCFCLLQHLAQKSFKRGCVGFSKNSCGAFSSHTTPPSMNTTRLATSRAKPISCVTTTMVMPSCASCFITSSTSRTISGVECAGRLVEQHHVRLHGKRTRNGNALLLSAGKLYRISASSVAQADSCQQLVRQFSASSFFMPFTRMGAAVTLSNTVMLANRLNCWNTMPILLRILSILVLFEVISTPSKMMCPPVGTSSRFKQRKKLDLPEPEGPITPQHRPCESACQCL